MKTELTATTPAGEFTRKTASQYTHIVVWTSPRAAAEAARERIHAPQGVAARWVKDRGHGVSWHTSEAAAHKAVKAGYIWDSKATLVGIFPVNVANAGNTN